MEKPTIEQIKKHFENAKQVRCLQDDCVYLLKKTSDRFSCEGSLWGSSIYNTIKLYDPKQGFAEIISYKQTQDEETSKNIDEINVIFDEVKENETDSALRYNTGKLKWSLVDFDSLEDMVKVLNFGAEKYEPNNWKKGLNTKQISDSLMRHLFAFLRGEDIDKESGLPHTGHIMCNAMFLSYMFRFSPDFDKRDIDENKKTI